MGNVATLVGNLIALRMEQRTGVLVVRCAETGTSIFLSAGEIIFANEDPRVETLGRMLLRQSKITRAQFDQTLARAADARDDSDAGGSTAQLRFAELLVELDILAAAEVTKAIDDQIRFRVMRVFQRREELSWQFQPHMESEMVFAPGTPGAALRTVAVIASPSIEELVLDAVRWIDDDHKNELGLFVALGQKLGIRAGDRASVVRRFALARDEAELLAKLDGKTSIGQVLSMSGAVDGPALLTALLLTNALERTDQAPAQPAVTPLVISPVPARAVATPLAITPVPTRAAPTPAPAAVHTAATARPPNVGVKKSDDDAPQSVRAGWWGDRGAVQTAEPKPVHAPPPAARHTPAPSSQGHKPIPPPPSPSRTFPAVSGSQPRIPAAPASQRSIPAAPASQLNIPTAAPASHGRIPAAPSSAGRIPSAPPSNPAPASGRVPAQATANATPYPQRSSAVMKALEAKRTGSRPNMPAVSAEDAKLLAEREFQVALGHYKAFRYLDASPGFTRAAELVPRSAEYKLYARWNHILQKGAPMQVGDRGEAWRLALAAVAADPASAFAHYVAGAVAQEDGQKQIAHRYLSRAVALDPQMVDAQRRLRIVDRREA